MSSLEDLFNRGTGAAAAFEKRTPVGTIVSGRITDVAVRQRTDMDGKPETWDDGNPKEQVVITFQAQPAAGEDDGKRRLFVKGWGDEFAKLREAVATGGDKMPQVGATITARYDGEGEQTKKGFNAPKLYSYAYQAGNPAESLFAKGATSAPLTAPAAPPAPPAADPIAAATANLAAGGLLPAPSSPAAPPAAPAAAIPPPPAPVGSGDPRITMIKTLAGAGLSPAQIRDAVPEFSLEAIAAVAGLVTASA